MRRFAERDPEYPRWNYPWDEMKPGDFFEVEPADVGKDYKKTTVQMRSAVNNASKRKKYDGWIFSVGPGERGAGDGGSVRVSRLR